MCHRLTERTGDASRKGLVQTIDIHIDDALNEQSSAGSLADDDAGNTGCRGAREQLLCTGSRNNDARDGLTKKFVVIVYTVHDTADIRGDRHLRKCDANSAIGDAVQSVHEFWRNRITALLGDKSCDECAETSVKFKIYRGKCS